MPTVELWAFGLSLMAALATVPAARWTARRWGLVDHPDGRRKMHRQPIPLAGGLGILAAILLAFFALGFHPSSHLLLAVAAKKQVMLVGIAAAVAILVGIGVADDFQLLRGRHKLLGQLFAVGALLLCGCVVRRLSLFGIDVELTFLAYPFTAFWLLGAINAFNLLDGMDGLLGTVAGLAAAAASVIGMILGNAPLAVAGAVLAGAILGFLCYNRPTASVFLGDSGSMVLGLLVGLLTLWAFTETPATFRLAPALGMVCIPVLDTTAAILRRKLTGRSLYATDRGHIHHVLLRRGLRPWSVLATLGGLTLTALLGAVFSVVLDADYPAVLGGVVVVSVLLAGGLFGWPELKLLANRCRHAVVSFFRGPGRDSARELQVHLHGTAAWHHLWRELTDFAAQSNLQSVRLDVSLPALHEEYHARWDRPHTPDEVLDLWMTTIPLTADGQLIGRLEIRGRRDEVPVCDRILHVARFVEDLERAAVAVTNARHADQPRSSEQSTIIEAVSNPAPASR
ncbi:MAG: undecaprenyl/decaprenyl-phosphate alpha-N-acetylglucosaminyl 1-phosphate transferase [Gemmatales bacterium]|nr:undecaprenyl/decaprenyl-phosphate alpha-N-acetylglucosaminyl 1-phosphate transferase [Gemmatales bacterium]MDW8386313.1 MraY family glycosyltransferase [Gemmatales bacterium]